MANKNFVERNDTAFRAQLATFVSVLQPAPTAYGMTVPEFEAFTEKVDIFTDDLAAFQLKQDAAQAATQTKDGSRESVEAVFRDLNRRIQANPAVSATQKQAAGLPVYDDSRTPVPPPEIVPVVIIDKSTRLAHELRIIDPANPKGGKPDGVSGYQVFYKIGPDAPADTRECVFAGNTTRSKFVVTFGGGDGNKQVWYIAVPFNTRGETGPMSETIAATIAA